MDKAPSNIWKSYLLFLTLKLISLPLASFHTHISSFFHCWVLKQNLIPLLLLPQDSNTLIKKKYSNIYIPCSQVEEKKKKNYSMAALSSW